MSADIVEIPFIRHIRLVKRRVNHIPFKKTDGGKKRDGFVFESRDCSVRSLALAAGISYKDAHDLCFEVGRKPRHGLSDGAICAAARKAGHRFNLLVTVFPNPMSNKGRELGFGTFSRVIRKYNKGCYILTSGNHAFAVRDGVLHDSWHVGGRTQVGLIIKFEPMIEPEPKPQITQSQINELWTRLDALEARS